MEHLHFVANHTGKHVTGFAEEALAAIKQYRWPGNIRELRNVVERAVILCGGPEIQISDLSETINSGPEIRLGGKMTLAEIENAHIQKVIANTATLDEAAAILGIDPATLYRRRKKLA
jgi:NtrC-family two-component system response regulator AlgB